ncbi:sensor histidine kinase [Asaia krungthepensis]|uniref:histidine kinase n=1 Tax=Asaia krungthepensis NRIC 0535 TaxID=1307925 RepID=A0ABQ0Q4W4_9PROT|nr:sensor histidine kinase [Asaia krungthepensis]GBQ91548.1 two component hybrid sensor histidine kinase and regulator [Asaia krungthepensis NRIC 0535]
METLSQITLHEEIAPRAFQLVQSISQQHYCSLELINDNGKVVASSLGSERDGNPCQRDLLPLARFDSDVAPDGLSKLQGDGGGAVFLADAVPLVRSHIKLEYVDRSGAIVPGMLVAYRPLINEELVANRQYARPPSDSQSGETDLWLYSGSGVPLPLTPRQLVSSPWVKEALDRLEADMKTARVQDHFRVGSVYYTLIPGYGPTSIVAVSVRSPAEARALQLFLARVMLIVLILVVELLLVALAAQRYLVEPLEKLAASVADWRRHGTFQPDLPHALPFEIRQMERAFSRATKRLDRHEARLQRATKQQDVLIREIHHRVKNNLQIVASLLNLQANRIKLPEARQEFHLVRDRVRTLATLHRYLYPEGGLSSLDIRAFLEELASQIFTANSRLNGSRISLSLDLQSLPVTPDQAVPLSLIVTEIVTNALRYAFPDERSGTVRIRLARQGDMAVLSIEDDGVGLAFQGDTNEDKREGIGLQLVRGFARQLGAKLDISSEAGTIYRLEFPIQTLRRHLA